MATIMCFGVLATSARGGSLPMPSADALPGGSPATEATGGGYGDGAYQAEAHYYPEANAVAFSNIVFCKLGLAPDLPTDATATPHTLYSFTATVTCLAWNPSGDSLALGDEGGHINILGSDCALIRTIADAHVTPPGFTGQELGVTGVDWNPDGTLLATSGVDSTVKVHRGDGVLVPRSTFTHQGQANCVDWSPDGRAIVSGCGGGGGGQEFLVSWNPDDGSVIHIYQPTDIVLGFFNDCHHCQWNPHGTMIVSSHFFSGGPVYVWDPDTGEEIDRKTDLKNWPGGRGSDQTYQSVFSPDGKYIASSNGFNAIVWEIGGNNNVMALDLESSVAAGQPNTNPHLPGLSWSESRCGYLLALTRYYPDGVEVWDISWSCQALCTPTSALLSELDASNGDPGHVYDPGNRVLPVQFHPGGKELPDATGPFASCMPTPVDTPPPTPILTPVASTVQTMKPSPGPSPNPTPAGTLLLTEEPQEDANPAQTIAPPTAVPPDDQTPLSEQDSGFPELRGVPGAASVAAASGPVGAPFVSNIASMDGLECLSGHDQKVVQSSSSAMSVSTWLLGPSAAAYRLDMLMTPGLVALVTALSLCLAVARHLVAPDKSFLQAAAWSKVPAVFYGMMRATFSYTLVSCIQVMKTDTAPWVALSIGVACFLIAFTAAVSWVSWNMWRLGRPAPAAVCFGVLPSPEYVFTPPVGRSLNRAMMRPIYAHPLSLGSGRLPQFQRIPPFMVYLANRWTWGNPVPALPIPAPNQLTAGIVSKYRGSHLL
eukprot:gene10325-1868_t